MRLAVTPYTAPTPTTSRATSAPRMRTVHRRTARRRGWVMAGEVDMSMTAGYESRREDPRACRGSVGRLRVAARGLMGQMIRDANSGTWDVGRGVWDVKERDVLDGVIPREALGSPSPPDREVAPGAGARPCRLGDPSAARGMTSTRIP